jgi:hypothetical protein
MAEVKCGDVAVGRIDGVDPVHAVVATRMDHWQPDVAEWYTLCGGTSDVEKQHLCAKGTRVTCARCRATLRRLGKLPGLAPAQGS